MYGNYQRKGSLIPTIIKSLQNLKKPILSAPLNLNDYIHVNDVCNAIIKSMENKLTSGIFNIGSGKLTSVLDIYKKNQLLFTLFHLHYLVLIQLIQGK